MNEIKFRCDDVYQPTNIKTQIKPNIIIYYRKYFNREKKTSEVFKKKRKAKYAYAQMIYVLSNNC